MYYIIAVQIASIVNRIEIKYNIQVSIDFTAVFLIINFIQFLSNFKEYIFSFIILLSGD